MYDNYNTRSNQKELRTTPRIGAEDMMLNKKIDINSSKQKVNGSTSIVQAKYRCSRHIENDKDTPGEKNAIL